MRLIGHLSEEAAAQTFCDYLYSQGIEAQVDPGAASNWEVWVLHDDDMERAELHLFDYAGHPRDPRYGQGAQAGAKQRKEDQKAVTGRRYRAVDGRQSVQAITAVPGGVTLSLMLISIVVAVMTQVGEKQEFINPLRITAVQVQDQYLVWDGSLPEVRQGQVWRLVSPIFLHFGYLHIFFNMLWLYNLGSVLESRRGSYWLFAIVVVLAVLSNLAQFVMRGPNFGGMSGVVYGLLGYIWIFGKLRPGSGLVLRQEIVTMMLIWLGLGFVVPAMGMANLAHLGGLLVGMAWGALGAQWTRWRR